MTTCELPAPGPTVEDVILALNAADEQQTSPLDRDGLRRLVRGCFHLGLAGEDGRDGFMIAVDEASACDGANYLWFKARFARFIYIDRIVVASARRGEGVGRALYAALVRRAADTGADVIGCEVNLQPPNPASDKFHAALGFKEIGRGAVHGGAKIVRYLALPLRGGAVAAD